MISLVRDFLSATIFNGFESYAHFGDLLDISSIIITLMIVIIVIRAVLYVVRYLARGRYD